MKFYAPIKVNRHSAANPPLLPYGVLRNEVRHGDCVKLMSTMKSEWVDFVLTDPPYVARYASSDGRIVPNDRHAWLRPGMAEIYRVLRPNRFAIITYSWAHGDKYLSAFRDAGFRFAGHFAFRKRYTSAARYLSYRHDVAYLLAKGSPPQPVHPISDMRDWDYSGNRLHPTQMPVSVLLPLVKAFSQPGDLVLDPFCGSGSTLLAAKLQGRNFVGFDIDATYARTTAARLGVRVTTDKDPKTLNL